MKKSLKPGACYHSLWIYEERFYDYGMFTQSDLEDSLPDLTFMAEEWCRVTSINVLPHITIGSKINDNMAKSHLKGTTRKINVSTETEALEIIDSYNTKYRDA